MSISDLRIQFEVDLFSDLKIFEANDSKSTNEMAIEFRSFVYPLLEFVFCVEFVKSCIRFRVFRISMSWIGPRSLVTGYGDSRLFKSSVFHDILFLNLKYAS